MAWMQYHPIASSGFWISLSVIAFEETMMLKHFVFALCTRILESRPLRSTLARTPSHRHQLEEPGEQSIVDFKHEMLSPARYQRRLSNLLLLSIVFLFFLISGCSVAPVTLEESLQTTRATRNDITDWDREMQYRVGFQYAKSALNLHDYPTIEVPPDASFDFQVPYAIYDLSLGNNLSAGIAFADWFNSGLSKNARYAHYYNRGLSFMAFGNTHYFTFDERDGVATPEDIHALFDEAYSLYQSVYNRSGDCYMAGFNEKDQYRRTYSKDVSGLTKEMAFRCPHPFFDDEEIRISVSAWARPFDGIRVMGAVQTNCYVDPPRGEKFVDTRICGSIQAEQNREYLPPSQNGWMELIVTPYEDTPYRYTVLTRFDGFTLPLPAPELKPDYTEFLASRDYPPK
jgi:hypothetical protein